MADIDNLFFVNFQQKCNENFYIIGINSEFLSLIATTTLPKVCRGRFVENKCPFDVDGVYTRGRVC